MAPFDETNWRTDKVLSVEAAAERAAELKQQGKRLVAVNGAFDLLHVGHLDQLEEAKQQGDVLFVGVNSDVSVAEAKGAGRPIVPEKARAALLAALVCVDWVVLVDEPYNEVGKVLLLAVRPQVYVNGPDYGDPTGWIEWPVMQEVGAEGYVVPRRNNLSTSEIVATIRS